MTGDQSRLLKVGDRVCWGTTKTDQGTIIATSWSEVTISWDDGEGSSVSQAVQPGRKIYSAPCKRCFGKGRLSEVVCPACNGTGFPTVMQPVQPGRKIFPTPCKRCSGKGRIGSPAKGVPFSFLKVNFMKKSKPKKVLQEVKCPACEGTGFPLVILQPIKQGYKLYPAPCKECAGKGRVVSPRP